MVYTQLSKEYLSASTTGKNVKVAATATPGTTIHTTASSKKDEVFLWAFNSHTSEVEVTVEWGGTTSPDDLVKYLIPAGEEVVICAGQLLGNGLAVAVFAGTANVVVVRGYVHRLAEQ